MLKKLKKKPVLFTTEDEVDIREGDVFYYIGDDFNICETKCLFKGDGDFTKTKTFSTKEDAEQYIEENEPKYSLNNIRKVFNFKFMTNEDIERAIKILNNEKK